MQVIFLIYIILVAWVGFQLIFPALTVVAERLFGRARRLQESDAKEYHFGCIITAYRHAAIAKPLIDSLLRQSYPHFHIYLVADACSPAELSAPDDPRVVIFQPDPPLNLKVRSIRYAVDRFQSPHDYTVVFDADNLAHPQFLDALNDYARRGYRCIQGRRTAKNTDTNISAADALGELYKNYIERYAPYRLGGSAVISGSGMATETGLYKAYLDSPAIAKGHLKGKRMLQEDKILQNFLLMRNERIAWAQEAVCYDEKVESAAAVQTQRSRWLFSYFQNIPNALAILGRGIIGLRGNQVFFGIVTLALPMFIQLALAVMLALTGLFCCLPASIFLLAAMGVFVLNILWTLKLSKAPKAVWKAVWKTPAFILQQALGLFKMINPDKHFKPSEHKKAVSVDDVAKDS